METENVAEAIETIDCWAPIWSAALQREFPPPATFDHIDVNDRSQEAIDAWVDAPRFRRDAITAGDVCGLYVDAEGWLPCGVSLRALGTFSWRQHLCFMDGALSRGRDGSLVGARRAFVVSALSGLSRWKSFVEVPKRLGMDTFQYRTKGEEEYVERLAALDPSLLTSWVGRSNVDDRAMWFPKPQLCVDFRYLEKASSNYWSNFVRNERRTRAATGYGVPYQYVTQNNILSAQRMVAYAKLTVGWSRIKVPMGYYAELPPVFSYKGSALLDPRSGYWVVGYTKLVAKTVAIVLFDAYDNYRIWRLSRRMIEVMRKLSLKPVLGSDRNVEEFGYILDLMSGTDFRRLPQHWRSRNKRRDQSDVLRQRFSADWCYYSPYTRKRISEREYQTLRRSPRLVRPANYPTGFDHGVEIPGWEEDEDSGVCNSCTEGEEADLDPLVEGNDANAGRASYYDDYGDVPMTSGNRTEGNVDHAAVIREFLLDVGLSESNLSGDLPELRGYLCGRLGL